MDQKYVHIAVFAHFKGLAGPHRRPFKIDAGGFSEIGGQVVQKAGVVRAGGCGHHQHLFSGHGRKNHHQGQYAYHACLRPTLSFALHCFTFLIELRSMESKTSYQA